MSKVEISSEKIQGILILIISVLFILLGKPEGIKEAKSVLTASSYKKAVVTRVIDGDTLEVQPIEQFMDGYDKDKEIVRLIGIDTPEMQDPREQVAYFAGQAKDHMEEFVLGEQVFLEDDSTQTDRDRYNRLIRYVFLSDGTNVNEKMIKDGYAFEYTYKNEYRYQSGFVAAQKYAKDNKLGLWGTENN